MTDVLIRAGQRSRNLSEDTSWQEQVRLVMDRLSECQRRWVGALLCKAVGWGGESFAAEITGLDAKTIRTGCRELDRELDGCPTDRVRREGAGRPRVEKKTLRSKLG